jgi:hypothetical protein
MHIDIKNRQTTSLPACCVFPIDDSVSESLTVWQEQSVSLVTDITIAL